MSEGVFFFIDDRDGHQRLAGELRGDDRAGLSDVPRTFWAIGCDQFEIARNCDWLSVDEDRP